MNSRWPEYDHIYYNQAIHSQVAYLELAAKVKRSRNEGKGETRNFQGWLVPIKRLRFAFTKFNLRKRAKQSPVD